MVRYLIITVFSLALLLGGFASAPPAAEANCGKCDTAEHQGCAKCKKAGKKCDCAPKAKDAPCDNCKSCQKNKAPCGCKKGKEK